LLADWTSDALCSLASATRWNGTEIFCKLIAIGMVNPRMTVGSATTYSRTPWHATCDSTMPDSGPSVCNVGDCVLVIFTRPPPGLSCLGVRNASGPRPCGCVRLVSTAETCTRTHAHAVAEVHRSHQDPVSDTRTPFRIQDPISDSGPRFGLRTPFRTPGPRF